MGTPGTTPFDVASPGPGGGIAVIRFTTAGAGVDPTTIEDEDAVVSSITYNAVGQYKVTLKREWYRVACFPEILDTTNSVIAKSVTESFGFGAPNYFVIQTESGGAKADTNGKVISAIFHLRTTARFT